MSTPEDRPAAPQEPGPEPREAGAPDSPETQPMEPVVESAQPRPPDESAPEAAPESTPEESAPPAPVGRPRPARRVLHRGLRFAAGIAVLALAGGAVLGAPWLPEPAEVNAAPLEVAVPPEQVALVCPGPVTTSTFGGTDSELSGASVVTSAATALVLDREGARAQAVFGAFPDPSTPLEEASEAMSLTARNPAGATMLLADPADAAAWAFASSVQRADAGDLRGLAATECPGEGSQAWFAAGRTTVGNSAVLTLRNPGATVATATLRAWGATGEVVLEEAPVVVGAGEQVDITLEAVVPDVDRLAIAVSASGGQVSATLHTLQLDGLTPAGIDVVAPGDAPSTLALIPALAVTETSVEAADSSLVRVLNPGTEAATVDVELLGETGSLSLIPGGLVVEAGTVSDVSLAGTPAGTYAIRVSSDLPVLAGASLVRVGTPAPEDPDVPVLDRAWVGAVPGALDAALAIPGLGEQITSATLSIGNGDDAASASVTVTGLDATGSPVAEQHVSLDAGTSLALDLAELGPGVSAVRVVSDNPVSTGVVVTGSDAFGEVISVIGAQADPQVQRSALVRLSGD